jgi:hypothetical protein
MPHHATTPSSILQETLLLVFLLERDFLLAIPFAVFQNLGCLESKPGDNRGKNMKLATSLVFLWVFISSAICLIFFTFQSPLLRGLCLLPRVLLLLLGEIEHLNQRLTRMLLATVQPFCEKQIGCISASEQLGRRLQY